MNARLLHIFLVWTFVYSGVTGALIVLQRLAPGMPLALKTLVLTIVLVPLIVVWIGPAAAALSARIVRPRS